MTPTPSVLSEVGLVTDFVVKHPRDAFSAAAVKEWRALGFTGEPDVARAIEEYDQFVEIITAAGAHPRFLPAAKNTGLDSIYARDASAVCAAGVVLCSMGKAQRAWEPGAQGAAPWVIQRSEERSYFFFTSAGRRNSRTNMVGTMCMWLTRWLSISRSMSSASKRGCSTIESPSRALLMP